VLNEDYMIGVPRPSRLPTGAGFSRPAGWLPHPSPLGVGQDERTAVGIAAAVLGNEIDFVVSVGKDCALPNDSNEERRATLPD
jgi:hypothetical protein